MGAVRKPHRQTVGDIKALARKIISEHGARALSLGALARALGITPPALYRYFDNRDALIIALMADIAHELASHLLDSVARIPEAEAERRFEVWLRAHADWARAHPQFYAFLFREGDRPAGADEAVTEPMLKAALVYHQVLYSLKKSGRLRSFTVFDNMPAGFNAIRATLQGMGERADADLFPIHYFIWVQVHAAIMREVDAGVSRELFRSGWLFDATLSFLREVYILPPTA